MSTKGHFFDMNQVGKTVPSISIIIPVYNNQEYLSCCVESVLKQTVPVAQIILVDDGSTDGSGALCDELATDSSVIQVVHQKNCGPAAARRLGVQLARGDYYGFVDADDLIDERMYGLLWTQLCNTDSDISCCGFSSFVNDDVINTPLHTGQESVQVFTGVARIEALMRNSDMMMSNCNKLYRATLFEANVWDTSSRREEDLLLNLSLFSRAQRVCLYSAPLYHYRTVENSLSHSTVSLDVLNDMDRATHRLCAMVENEPELATLVDSCRRERDLYQYTLVRRERLRTVMMNDRARSLRHKIRKDLGTTMQDTALPVVFRAAALCIATIPIVYDLVARISKPRVWYRRKVI